MPTRCKLRAHTHDYMHKLLVGGVCVMQPYSSLPSDAGLVYATSTILGVSRPARACFVHLLFLSQCCRGCVWRPVFLSMLLNV